MERNRELLVLVELVLRRERCLFGGGRIAAWKPIQPDVREMDRRTKRE